MTLNVTKTDNVNKKPPLKSVVIFCIREIKHLAMCCSNKIMNFRVVTVTSLHHTTSVFMIFLKLHHGERFILYTQRSWQAMSWISESVRPVTLSTSRHTCEILFTVFLLKHLTTQWAEEGEMNSMSMRLKDRDTFLSDPLRRSLITLHSVCVSRKQSD